MKRYQETHKDLDGQDWKLIVFFLDKAYDPGVKTLGPLAGGARRWLLRGVLPKLLAQTQRSTPYLNVLRPLAVKHVNGVRQQGPAWVQSIQNAPELGERERSSLLDLLIKFVVQRFVDLPYKEVETMLKLMPIEQTRADQELIELGHQEGRQEDLREGIMAVLSVRFLTLSTNQQTHIAELLNQIHDEETIELLRNLAQQIELPAIFEQKVAELAATLQKDSSL